MFWESGALAIHNVAESNRKLRYITKPEPGSTAHLQPSPWCQIPAAVRFRNGRVMPIAKVFGTVTSWSRMFSRSRSATRSYRTHAQFHLVLLALLLAFPNGVICLPTAACL